MACMQGRAALVVDDDDFVRGVVIEQLRAIGFGRLVAAADVPAARTAIVEAFDVIVLDLRMPAVDGVEFLRDLARMRSSAGLILISAVDPKTRVMVEDVARARGCRRTERTDRRPDLPGPAQGAREPLHAGVHTGEVVRMPDGDIMGAAVNVAARLMSAAQKAQLLVSVDAREPSADPTVERIACKGISEPVACRRLSLVDGAAGQQA